MDSPRTVLVREPDKVSLVNLKTKAVTPLNVKVDSAIMNPTQNILGLRGKMTRKNKNYSFLCLCSFFDLSQKIVLYIIHCVFFVFFVFLKN